jgi:hypothetical protein
MQHHAADELHIVMALAEGPLGGLADGGEGGNEDVVEGLAFGELGGNMAVRPRRASSERLASSGSSALISGTRASNPFSLRSLEVPKILLARATKETIANLDPLSPPENKPGV